MCARETQRELKTWANYIIKSNYWRQLIILLSFGISLIKMSQLSGCDWFGEGKRMMSKQKKNHKIKLIPSHLSPAHNNFSSGNHKKTAMSPTSWVLLRTCTLQFILTVSGVHTQRTDFLSHFRQFFSLSFRLSKVKYTKAVQQVTLYIFLSDKIKGEISLAA